MSVRHLSFGPLRWLVTATALGGGLGVGLGACRPPPAETLPAAPKAAVEMCASVDRAVATTGDILRYSVVLDVDPAYEVELSEPGAEIAGFRIVEVGREKPRTVGGRTVDEHWYDLRADLVGSYVLPSLTATYRRKDAAEGSEPETVSTSEIFVEVESVLPADGEATDIRELKPLLREARRIPWRWIGLGAAGLLLLLGLLLWRHRRQRRLHAVPPTPPHEVAFAALRTLRQTNFDELAAVRRYYFAISEVLRTYVEACFELNATDLTTEEILPRLLELGRVAEEQRQALRRFLLETDQVKYAARQPSKEDIETVYEGALSFVEATRPIDDELRGAA